MTWNPTKRWAVEKWTQSDAGLYVHDNMLHLHHVNQGIVGFFANGVTITSSTSTPINQANILPYTPDVNGVLETLVVMTYVSTASGAPTTMYAIDGTISTPDQHGASLTQYVGWFNGTITAGANPSLVVNCIVDTGSIVADVSAIAWATY